MGERNSMRRKLVIASILISMTGVITYAQTQYDFENQEYCFVAYYDDLRSPPFRFSFIDTNFYCDIPELEQGKLEEGQRIKGTIQGRYNLETKDGYIYMYVNEKKYVVLYYESIVCILIDCANNDTFFGFNKDSKYFDMGDMNRSSFIGITGHSLRTRTSSYLEETIGNKKITYNGFGGKYYYQITKPWVEGKPGSGIGEWREFDIYSDTDEILFFNGYIDPNRPDLYRANARVKEIRVSSGGESWVFPIEDTPHPQILTIPKMITGTIRFTIEDVYEGDKYTDTCIGGIYFLLVRGEPSVLR
jgi:hypothetical protein